VDDISRGQLLICLANFINPGSAIAKPFVLYVPLSCKTKPIYVIHVILCQFFLKITTMPSSSTLSLLSPPMRITPACAPRHASLILCTRPCHPCSTVVQTMEAMSSAQPCAQATMAVRRASLLTHAPFPRKKKGQGHSCLFTL
jgi:hypothetical protein